MSDKDLRISIVAAVNRLIHQGKNIYGGMFYGGDAQNVQLSMTKKDNGDTMVTYCYYSQMFMFTIHPDELLKP